MTCDVANLEQRFTRFFLGSKFKTPPRPLANVSHPHCRNQALLEVAQAGHSSLHTVQIHNYRGCLDLGFWFFCLNKEALGPTLTP